MTISRRRPLISGRLLTSIVAAGVLVLGCAGSDASAPGSVPEGGTTPDVEGDIFSDGQTETVGTGVGDDPAGDESVATATSESGDDEGTDDGSSAPSQPDGGEVEDADSTGVETTPSVEPDEPDPSTGSGGSDDLDPVPADPDDIDDIDDIITLDEVDDVAFCQAYARVFEAFLGISFAGAFGGIGSADPDALIASTETYEVLVYPGLTSDVETIRAENVAALELFFEPIFERIDAAPGLLRDAGLSDDEIDALTAGVRPSDLQAVELDDLDPRVTDAAVALVRDFGSFIDASEALGTTGSETDAEAFEERLAELCPLLNDAFDAG